MGAGLQTSLGCLGLGHKQKIKVRKRVRLFELLGDGHDINQLIQEYIVPIDGIICTHHAQADGKRDAAEDEKESGHAQVVRINELLRNLKYKRLKSSIEFKVPLRGHTRMMLSSSVFEHAAAKELSAPMRAMTGLQRAATRVFSPSDRQKRRFESGDPEYHPEVCRVSMCRAYMYAAEIDSTAQQPGGAARDISRIEMTIHGYLFFPPFHTSDRLQEDPPKKVLHLYPPEVELAQSPSKVAIEVPAYLHDPNGSDDILGLLSSEEHVSQLAPPRLTCRHVKLAHSSDEGGDPMLDAWLPVSDIEHQIEFMLNEHMAEKLWHPD